MDYRAVKELKEGLCGYRERDGDAHRVTLGIGACGFIPERKSVNAR